jgi:chromate reductase, NAD(P)H dehydrogenase (quinone)
MKILGISSVLRKASTNTGLLRALGDVAPDGVTVDVATLHDVPMFDEDLEKSSGKPDVVKALDARIRAADGIVFAVAEYNFSVPGVLKNATDWLSRGGSPFKWRKVGVIGASGGPVGTARVQYHFRQNLQGLEAITMPKPEFFAGNNGSKFDEDGNLTDEASRKMLRTWLDAYITFLNTKL